MIVSTWQHAGMTCAMRSWWIGFDMGHAGDFDFMERKPLRTFDECKEETERLAEQIAGWEEK